MKKIYLSKKYLILGANGLLGSRLKSHLENKGLKVWGTSKKKKYSGLLYLNTAFKKSIENFPWSKFDVIVDCIGNIDYRNELKTAETNISTNVLGPISIIRQLSQKHRYFYLSTHAVFLSDKKHNSYSFSKKAFEQLIGKINGIAAMITIIRMPAIFSEERNSGLLFNIKESFLKKKPFVIRFDSNKWHTMHIARAINVLGRIILSEKYFENINIGYPAESSIKNIIKIANRIYRGNYVSLAGLRTDHYIPDLKNQNDIVKLSASDMKQDLEQFFSKGNEKIVKDRVTGIVIYRKKILLMYRVNNGKKYYTFPGGGIEKGEAKDAALKRETREETSIKVKPKKLLYEIRWDKSSKQYFYLCDYVNGSPKLGDFNEREAMKDGTQYYEPKWYNISGIDKMLIYPLEVRDLLLEDLKLKKWGTVKNLSLQLSTSRQTI